MAGMILSRTQHINVNFVKCISGCSIGYALQSLHLSANISLKLHVKVFYVEKVVGRGRGLAKPLVTEKSRIFFTVNDF